MKKEIKNKKNNLVSVIISTRNEEDVIKKLLVSLKKQTYKNIEIIVVDNNSSDKTKKIAKKFTKKVFNFGPERSAQRNFGVKKAKGDYLLILDADMELTLKVVEECVMEMTKNKKIGAVIIPEKSVGENFWEKVKSFERSFYANDKSFLTDSARFFSKNMFLSAGGYDETITGTEDWDLSESVRKKGFEISWIKSFIYHHERIPILWKHARKFYYYGIDSQKTLKKQNVKILSSKTIHFLRPVFYRQRKKLVSNPILLFGMIVMLSSQMFFGGLGYVVGRFKKN